jgi:thiamine biosynthesis lipoprotein
MISVFETMGTVVSLDHERPVPETRTTFDAYDRIFSLYRADSELSRIASGSLRLTDASAAVRDAYEEALDWRAQTAGAFTPHRPDGVLDLSGVVKALAMGDAGRVLAGAGEWILGCGGDVLTSGHEVTVGIADPADRSRLLT